MIDEPKAQTALPPLPLLEDDDPAAMADTTVRDTFDMITRCPTVTNWWRDRAERLAKEVIRLKAKVAAYEARTMEGRTR